MKLFVILLLSSCGVLINAQFSKKLENLNVDQILKNDRILTSYVKCMLEKGPCTSEGRELKVTMPSTLKSACLNCSEKERSNSRKMINHLIQKKPKDWALLQAKYDPSGQDTARFLKEINL